jgi:hypothetical protein
LESPNASDQISSGLPPLLVSVIVWGALTVESGCVPGKAIVLESGVAVAAVAYVIDTDGSVESEASPNDADVASSDT